jgi:hypothetical protein
MNKTFKNGVEPRQAYWRYEIMLYRGEDVIDQGTIEEIANRRGVQKLTIYYYLQPIAAKRAATRKRSDRGLVAVRV